MTNNGLAVVRGWRPATRWSIVAVICLAAATVAAFIPPIAQPQAYHQFADQRTFWGIARSMDVLSNIAFLVPGLLGLFYVLKAGLTLDAGTRWALATLFFGLVLTSVGSAYYHLDPDNQRLVFDRLPMIVAMSGALGAVIADRFGGATAWSLAGLMTLGLWSVHESAAT